MPACARARRSSRDRARQQLDWRIYHDLNPVGRSLHNTPFHDDLTVLAQIHFIILFDWGYDTISFSFVFEVSLRLAVH